MSFLLRARKLEREDKSSLPLEWETRVKIIFPKDRTIKLQGMAMPHGAWIVD